MHPEEQIGHAMCQYTWPEAACPVEEEVVESARHHAGEPEGMFTTKEHYRHDKRDGGKRSKWDRRKLGSDVGLLSRHKGDDKPEQKGPPEEFLHQGHHHCSATQPHGREQCPSTRTSLPRIVAGSLAKGCPGPVHTHPEKIDHRPAPIVKT